MQHKGKGNTQLVIYKDNMKVHLDGNYPDCSDWTLFIIQICCMVSVILAPILHYVKKDDEMFKLAGGYIVYLILSWCTDTCRFLSNVKTVAQVIANIETARRVKPEIYFKISCYHHEEREFTYNGKSETRTVSVTTHSAK